MNAPFSYLCFVVGLIVGALVASYYCGKECVVAHSGRFDVSVHYEDATLKVYTLLDTVYCKNYIATTAGGLELLEVNKPCLNKKQKRNQ